MRNAYFTTRPEDLVDKGFQQLARGDLNTYAILPHPKRDGQLTLVTSNRDFPIVFMRIKLNMNGKELVFTEKTFVGDIVIYHKAKASFLDAWFVMTDSKQRPMLSSLQQIYDVHLVLLADPFCNNEERGPVVPIAFAARYSNLHPKIKHFSAVVCGQDEGLAGLCHYEGLLIKAQEEELALVQIEEDSDEDAGISV